jgi:hypothetical protein
MDAGDQYVRVAMADMDEDRWRGRAMTDMDERRGGEEDIVERKTRSKAKVVCSNN